MKRTVLLLISILALSVFAAKSFAAPDPHAEDAAHQTDAHAADAHGDDHGDHAGGHGPSSPITFDWKEGAGSALTAIVVFLIVFAVLATAVWPKITKGLDERNEKITSEIAAAEAARQQAKEALDEYEKNLAEARAESHRMLEETKSQQAELAAQLKAKADAELSELRERAMADIEGAKKQALSELYAESVNLATVMAGKILQREVSAGDEQRLMDESLEEMKSVNA